jgi:dynactin complex subunit
MLGLLHPLIVKQLEIARRFKLIEAVKELVTGEEDTSFLSAEYKDILREEAGIRHRFSEQPGLLQFIYNMVADLFGDAAKSKGRQNIADNLKQLRHVLNNYDRDQVQALFSQL